MPNAKAPEQQTGDQEQAGNQRQDKQPGIAAAVRQIKERIILHERKRDNIRENFHNGIAVDRNGVGSDFPSAVCEDVDEY